MVIITQFIGELFSLQILAWYFVFQAMSISFFILYSCLSGSDSKQVGDSGYGVSKAFGIFFISLVIFNFHIYISKIHAIHLSRILISIVLLVFLIKIKSNQTLHNPLKVSLKEVLYVEFLFLLVWVFFLFARSYYPEIHWGEKPMDFTFFNFYYRMDTFSEQDPWAAGSKMIYYYFGYYVFSLLSYISGVSTKIGYNLSVAMVPAMLACSLYSLLRCFSSKKLLIVILCILPLIISNYELLRLFIFENKQLDTHLFWASSRLFTSPGFSEYPQWSILFADLHPHYMSLPIVFSSLFFLYQVIYRDIDDTKSFLPFISNNLYSLILGVNIGILISTNTWDAIILFFCLLFSSIIFLTYELFRDKNKFIKILKKLSANVLFIFLAVFFSSSKFIFDFLSTQSLGMGFVELAEFNSFSSIIMMHGVWLCSLAVIFLLVFLYFKINKKIGLLSCSLLIGLIPIGLGFMFEILSKSAANWEIVIFVSFFLFMMSIIVFSLGLNRNLLFILSLTILISFLILFSEHIFLGDRMNTIFKFHSKIFLFLAICLFSLTLILFEDETTLGNKSFIFKKTLIVLICFFFLPALYGGYLNFHIFTKTKLHWSIEEFEPKKSILSFDGLRYLNKSDPDLLKAVDWVNKNIKGLPTVLEAHGASYGGITRFSANTGLPVLLGWEHHVFQRGLSRHEIALRGNDIRTIYSISDVEKAYQILKRNKVKYVVVGKQEQQMYPKEGLEKFFSPTNYFKKIYSLPSISLFEVT